MLRVLSLLFILSGAAGLMYESVWTRYLGLFVGHDAYAQIIVLVIFLGGMSAGAIAVSRYSERIREPLYGYVAIEFAVGLIGLVFHDIFQATTSWAYASVFPGLAGSWALTAAKWGIASALILPQSVLLGATFPLMSAGALRLQRNQPGRTLAMLYFANSLGAAAGVLVAGFYLVGLAGLPGTLLAAAMLNFVVACGTIGLVVVIRNRAATSEETATTADASPSAGTSAAGERNLAQLRRLLLVTSFGTAVASFIYEIGWIRMLALVLGSATHSFELMLSAFILGLALGALWIRSRADRLHDPLRTLGIVQWIMGCLVLATLPLYLRSFDWTATLLSTFGRTDAGYTGFTIARYAICLAIMLPATFCAGMTLPLITRILLTTGSGERAIGAVYGWNTLGSILGVAAGGLVLLPSVGLKGMLVAGALVDIGLGVLLFVHARREETANAGANASATGGRTRVQDRAFTMAGVAAASVVAAVAIAGSTFEPWRLTSGVFRTGRVGTGEDRDVQFYRDGRTATVSGVQYRNTRVRALATNGKPDASLPEVWFRSCDSVRQRVILKSDPATQTLLPLVTLAHAPRARTAAIIGQGSGMSSHLLLASPALQSLVTIEIEPEMIEGSRIFYPANRRAFDDPRSSFVIDDAKSYFASARQRYDLIMSEPSNPWVSGVSGLFTTEFYARVREYLSDDGVFGQWLHVYELDDGLALSVLAALHQNFASYEVYLVPSGDLLIVASNRPKLSSPDWSVASLPALQQDLCRFVPLSPGTLDALHIAGRRELAPLLDGWEQPNSDFYPILDLGAERRRFLGNSAAGFAGLSADWFNLVSSVAGRRIGPSDELLAALPQNPRLRARSTGAFLRNPSDTLLADSVSGPLLRTPAFEWQLWQASLATDRAPLNWERWTEQASTSHRLWNGGTAGFADETRHAETMKFLERHNAPATARDVVVFQHALASWNFREAAAAADRLVPIVMKNQRWIDGDELRDGAVMAKLHIGDAAGAERLLKSLAPLTQRGPGDLRTRLLEAYVRIAASERQVSSGPRPAPRTY